MELSVRLADDGQMMIDRWHLVNELQWIRIFNVIDRLKNTTHLNFVCIVRVDH